MSFSSHTFGQYISRNTSDELGIDEIKIFEEYITSLTPQYASFNPPEANVETTTTIIDQQSSPINDENGTLVEHSLLVWYTINYTSVDDVFAGVSESFLEYFGEEENRNTFKNYLVDENIQINSLDQLVQYTAFPSFRPTLEPTTQPTKEPSKYPSFNPTPLASDMPSSKPSSEEMKALYFFQITMNRTSSAPSINETLVDEFNDVIELLTSEFSDTEDERYTVHTECNIEETNNIGGGGVTIRFNIQYTSRDIIIFDYDVEFVNYMKNNKTDFVDKMNNETSWEVLGILQDILQLLPAPSASPSSFPTHSPTISLMPSSQEPRNFTAHFSQVCTLLFLFLGLDFTYLEMRLIGFNTFAGEWTLYRK